jgi:hypothetical protein
MSTPRAPGGRWKLLEAFTVALALTLGGFLIAAETRGVHSAKNSESVCRQHLNAIGVALRAYRNDHASLPPSLLELYPTYTSDRSVFTCPEARTPEWKRNSYLYVYKMVTELSRTQKADRDLSAPGVMYITWEEARSVRGEKVPVAFCPRHDPHPNAHDPVRKSDPKYRYRMLVLRLDGTVEKAIEAQARASLPERYRPPAARLWFQY